MAPMLLLASLLSAHAATTSVTVSPVHFNLPVLEASVERALTERFTAAVIGGGGRSSDIPVWEAGAQGRYLFWGDFGTNVHVAVEGLFLRASQDALGATFTSRALSAGPLLGAKWAAEIGFTAEIQAGVAYTSYKTSGSGGLYSADDSGADPNININLGWSF